MVKSTAPAGPPVIIDPPADSEDAPPPPAPPGTPVVVSASDYGIEHVTDTIPQVMRFTHDCGRVIELSDDHPLGALATLLAHDCDA